MNMPKLKALTVAISAAMATSSALALDFGQKVEQQAKAHSVSLFGTVGTLDASSTIQAPATAGGCDLITLAQGLTCSVVSEQDNLAAKIDMMVLYPNDANPTHIVACNEAGSGNGSVQRISLATGFVENIVSSGLTSCDPVEITPWGTVVFGEENGASGRMFEILNPLTTTDVTVSGSGAATATSDNAHVRYLPALGQLSFEGISILPNGVALYQDENRPSKGVGGGGYFKFIPTTAWSGGAPIDNLEDSPLAGGRVFALRLGRNSGNTDFGQGNFVGRGVWVEVTDGNFGAPTTTAGVDRLDLRAAANTLKATQGYRPEDQDIDKKAAAMGNVRVCGTNTGQDVPADEANGDNNFGTTFCLTDGTLAESATLNTTTQTVNGVTYNLNEGEGTSIPEYQILVQHHLDFGMPDNIAY